MPYPEAMVKPMREELTRIGVQELRDASEVDHVFGQETDGTTLLVINSVCGCAAANARPAVALAQRAEAQPDRYVTVFAGQDVEATDRAREFLPGIPPSSPFMALFKDGDPVYVVERKHIEGRSANAIASDLAEAFAMYCTESTPDDAPSGPETESSDREQGGEDLPSTFKSIM